jgi:hypothetical protein
LNDFANANSMLPDSLLKNLIAPTFDSIGLESRLGFMPAPSAERVGHSSWRPSEGIFNRLLRIAGARFVIGSA